jgi:hypothetical protein
MEDIVEVKGEIVRGHGVASAGGSDDRFPLGTIVSQLPFFRQAIGDFDAYLGESAYAGTINLLFAESNIKIKTPEYVLRSIRWTNVFPPEKFYLSKATLLFEGHAYPVFLYIPDPGTKPDHLQHSGVLELIGPFIPGVYYGAPATLYYSGEAISIIEPRLSR